MQNTPFSLRERLDFNAAADPGDSLRAKKAFRRLGYFGTPSYGLTPYPDQPLFDAIRGFQSDHGLRRDGVMKPGGETARKLGAVLADRTRPPRRKSDANRPAAVLRSLLDMPKDEKPEKPETPDTPKPEADCRQLRVDLANAYQAENEAREQAKKFDAEHEKWKTEFRRLASEQKKILAELAAELAIPAIRISKTLTRIKSERPGLASLISRLSKINDDMENAERNINSALSSRHHFQEMADDYAEQAAVIREAMENAGC